jgi:hypothetical protein
MSAKAKRGKNRLTSKIFLYWLFGLNCYFSSPLRSRWKRESCPYSGSTTAIWEEVKNTIFVSKFELGNLSYATRATTIVLVDHNGHATFIEREWYQSTSELSYQLHIEGNSGDPQRRYEFDLNK